MTTPSPTRQKDQLSLVYVARTIRRWAQPPIEREEKKRAMRERHRARQYGYAFPIIQTQIQMQHPDQPQM